MMRRLPWRIFADWMKYAKREPFGELRADLRAGQIAAILAHAYGGKKVRNVTAATFFPELQPFFGRSKRQAPTPDVLYQKLAIATALMGGIITRKSKDDIDA